jgi:hypothetical protein
MPAPAAPPAIDAAALESRILAAVKEKSREEASQWVNTLRAEIVRVQSRLTRDQNDALVQALSVVEGRMNARVEQAANMLQERSSQGIAGLYDTVSLERQADVAELDARLSRLASSSAAQASETTAILETLLQVAELRNRQ